MLLAEASVFFVWTIFPIHHRMKSLVLLSQLHAVIEMNHEVSYGAGWKAARFCLGASSSSTLLWRHHEPDCVSNRQPHDCLLNRLSGTDQRKHQSSASLAFVRGIHRRPVSSSHKWPVTRKMFPFDDVILTTRWIHWCCLSYDKLLKWTMKCHITRVEKLVAVVWTIFSIRYKEGFWCCLIYFKSLKWTMKSQMTIKFKIIDSQRHWVKVDSNRCKVSIQILCFSLHYTDTSLSLLMKYSPLNPSNRNVLPRLFSTED